MINDTLTKVNHFQQLHLKKNKLLTRLKNSTGIASTQDGGNPDPPPLQAGSPRLRSAATGFTVHPGVETGMEKTPQIPDPLEATPKSPAPPRAPPPRKGVKVRLSNGIKAKIDF